MKYHPVFEAYGVTSEENAFPYLQSTFTNSIMMWDYLVNWEGALGNLKKLEVDLNTLNYLVGKEDVKAELAYLLKQYPQLARTIPVLLASRDQEFEILIDYAGGKLNHKSYSLKSALNDAEIEAICEFAEYTGLLNLFRQKNIKSVPDYVLGVEVGLDTNGRKNRGGTAMEAIVASFLEPLCKTLNADLEIQANAKKIKRQWGIDVQVKKSSRKFDFAIRFNNHLTLIEVNFYGGEGSKLKATAGEYCNLFKELAPQGHSFIWITDGAGWHKTWKPLSDAFYDLDYILNLKMATSGLLADILRLESE